MLTSMSLNYISKVYRKHFYLPSLILSAPYFQFVPILFVISTSSMLIMDQRTMQIKYRIPASEIIRLSLSPYFDDIAVFHVKAVSKHLLIYVELLKLYY